MNRNVMQAMERLERAREETLSRQPRLGAPVDRARMFSSVYRWLQDERHNQPVYKVDSRDRDKWLSKVWMREPHIAGVVNSVISIDRNRDWSLTGGRNVVNRYNNILRNAEDGEGWRYFAGRAALSFYTSDLGAVTEVGREGEGGPSRAFYNVDPARCYLTGNMDTPLSYSPLAGKEQAWRPDYYFRTTSLPTIQEELRGLGYCALSRIWSLVEMLIAVYEHDMEQLGARAPKGLLLLQNISEQQWVDAMKARDAALNSLERERYGGVAILAQEGVDQIDAKLIALSQLPAGFDIEVTTKLLMWGIALGFAYDPIEFWPVESGTLGRGRETEIQHQKATGKGGVEFARTLQDRLQGELPPTLLFEFEQRDVSGQMEDAQVAKAWSEVFNAYYDKGTGILTAEEVRQLMVDQGIIPSEWTLREEESQIDSTGEQRAYDWMWHPAVWRSALVEPTQSIVQYRTKTDRTKILSPSGYEMIRKHREHPMAQQSYDEFPVQEFRDVFSYRVFPVPQLRETGSTLYSEDGVEITMEDVKRAVDVGLQRVGQTFAGLLMAEPEEE